MQLVRYEAARSALAEAHRVDEVMSIRDKAEALAAYARQAKDAELIQWATEIKVRAERKAGWMLIEAAERGLRATKGDNRYTVKTSDDGRSTPTLSALGLTHNDSSRFQKVARMTEEHFEAAVATAKAVNGEVTTAFMLRQAAPRQEPQQADASSSVVIPSARSRSQLDQATELFSAIETIASCTLSGIDVFDALPRFQHYRIDENIDAAVSRLQEIRKEWTKATKRAA